MANPSVVAYLDNLAVWSPPDQVVSDILTYKGIYTHMLMAFWTKAGPLDVAEAWINGTFPSNAIDSFHDQGIKVMVSAGGATESPVTGNPQDGTDYGQAVGQFASANGFDGVDFDIENIAPGQSTDAAAWLVAATQGVKTVFSDAIISHAPQAPYFDPQSGFDAFYQTVEQQAGDSIDFYNVQFYNQDSSSYDTYETLFVDSGGWSPQSAVQQISAGGTPLSKIVVGKPVTQADVGNTGYVDPTDLASFIQQGVAAGITPGGVMGWQWISDRNSDDGTWSNTVAAPLLS